MKKFLERGNVKGKISPATGRNMLARVED